MTRTLLVFLLALAVPAPAQLPTPGYAEVSREAFRARYRAMRLAADGADAVAAGKYFTQDFVNIDLGGRRIERAEWLEGIGSAPPPPPGNQRNSDVLAVDYRGHQAWVRERYETRTPYPTTYGPHVRRWIVVSNDLWRRERGAWRMAYSESVEGWTYCDAALVSHQVAPRYLSATRRPFAEDADCPGRVGS